MFQFVNRVFTRIAVLAVLAVGALAVVGWFAINESRNNLYDQKKADVRHIVEVVTSMIAGLDKRVAAGEMTKEQAQAEAKKLIVTLRYQSNDYIFVNSFEGISIVHPVKPDNVGKNLTGNRDANGKLFIQEFLEVAKNGGGHVFYGFQAANATEFVDKLSYVAPYRPWGWIIGSGVLIDDVEALHRATMRHVLAGLAAIAVILIGAAYLSTRSVVRPLGRLTGSLRRLASGDIEANVEGSERGDEFGVIARAVVDVRDHARRQAQERMERDEEAKRAAEAERRRVLTDIAQSLDRQVKAVTDTVDQAASELVETARSMEAVSENARREAGEASEVSKRTAEHAKSVGDATRHLDGSINEISTHVAQSSKMSEDAVTQIREASGIVRTLSEASADIGKVVALIQAVAAQTNLLALNATIEAARAGEAGKGFAVVAAEVKQLATQTSQATGEITSRIAAVHGATDMAVASIEGVGRTVSHLNEIALTIAAAVVEQGAATGEIARSIGETATQSTVLASSLASLLQAADDTTNSSRNVVKSASGLSADATTLKQQVEQFVAKVANA
jgi:methyl-accepting chemotaxis protein